MIQVEGPIRDHLEDPSSDERIARLEQKIAARRLGRAGKTRRYSMVLIPALAAAAALAVIFLPSREEQPPVAKIEVAAPEPAASWIAPEDDLSARELVQDTQPAPELPSKTAKRPATGGNVGRIEPVAAKTEIPTVDRLWAEADAARAGGDLERAVIILGQIAAEYSTEPRAGLASFIRARIFQDELGRPKEAAEAIALALKLGLAEDLRESARARLFDAYDTAGDRESARSAAFEYLASHPEGRRAAAAKRLAGVDSR